MNELDLQLVEKIKTKPWVELSLLGVQIDVPVSTKMRVTLTWVEEGEEQERWSEVVGTQLPKAERAEILREITAFARGAIPIAWFHDPIKKALLEVVDLENSIDRTLCFLLRPMSRWLDPRVWCRTRTGKYHSIETIAKSIGYGSSFEQPPVEIDEVDPAVLAYELAYREGFPIRRDWTASELAHWQEDARAAHLREEMPATNT